MIKYLLRKTIYKKYDKESQDRLLALDAKERIVKLSCILLFPCSLFYIYIFLGIIVLCEDLGTVAQIAIVVFLLTYTLMFATLTCVFQDVLLVFWMLFAQKVYFLLCTKKGKAISNEDFKKIERINNELYTAISTQKCCGYCYSICFYLCKTLRKGKIEFIAMKLFTPNEEKEKYTIHVLYINNGWAFDTFSSRQYPIEELDKLFMAKIYKSFSFRDIATKDYEEFRDEEGPNLAIWAEKNNCSASWNLKEEET